MATSTSTIVTYDYLFKELADGRCEKWTLMSNPGPILYLVGIWLLLVKFILPKYMENRKPFDLKNIIYWYNLFQIAACTFLIWGTATSGWTTRYTLGCEPVDYSNDPLAVRMLHMVYYTFLLKICELVETIFFCLRKKQNQVSNLHVYHHASTVIIAWVGVKYIGGGMATMPIMLNSFIHILMYAYYWLSSLGPEWQKTLAKWKPKLTIAQMIQFCILIAHSLQAVAPSCKAPKWALLFYLPNVLLIFYMFYDFYKKAYLKKKRMSLTGEKNNNLNSKSKSSQKNGLKSH